MTGRGEGTHPPVKNEIGVYFIINAYRDEQGR
jgi:hypothetical protein